LQRGATVPVLPGEFRLEGYDATRGVMSVSLQEELAPMPSRQGRFRVRAGRTILVPVAPGLFKEVFEANASGAVGLELEVEPLSGEGAGPSPAEDVLDVRPTHARVRIDAMPVAEGTLAEPGARRPPGLVTVGEVTSERELPGAQRLQVAEAAAHVAIDCARRASAEYPSLRGSLMVELERSPVGERLDPRVTVDVTVCRRLESCLLDGLKASEDVWSALGDGDRVWVPVYFKGGPLDAGSGSGPAVSGTTSP
jgi:hypothetical protein